MWRFKQFSTNIAIIDELQNSYTYDQLLNEIEMFDQQIRDEKSLVFVLATNSLSSITAYVSLIEHKHVPLLLPATIDHDLLSNLIQEYQPHYVFAPKDYKLDDDLLMASYFIRDYVLYQRKSNHHFVIHQDLALLLSTSGSTGSPKLIRLSYQNLSSNMTAIASYLELNSQDRAITTLPMNYTYGLSILNSHLFVGGSIVLTDHSVIEDSFWKLFDTYQPTSLNGVPYTYSMLNRILLRRENYGGLRYLTQAGGKLSTDLQGRFSQYCSNNNLKFYIMYGQTEATARMSYLRPEKARTKLDSIGQAIPGGTFMIMNEDQQEIIEPFVIGELVYHGPNVFMGYASNYRELERGDTIGGLLKTGDLAYFDYERDYYIKGRTNRFVKIYGVRVNLDEVEQIIKTELGIDDIVVVGVEDIIYIVCVQSISLDFNKVSSKIGIHPSVFKNIVKPAILRNESGKPSYKLILEEMNNE